ARLLWGRRVEPDALLKTAPVHGTVASVCFFFQAEDGIRDRNVTGVQTCALPIFFQADRRVLGGTGSSRRILSRTYPLSVPVRAILHRLPLCGQGRFLLLFNWSVLLSRMPSAFIVLGSRNESEASSLRKDLRIKEEMFSPLLRAT